MREQTIKAGSDKQTHGNAALSEKPPPTEEQIRATLLQDVIELTARNERATEEIEAVTGLIHSDLPHPDGVQRIKNASNKLSTARNELMKAHSRLDEHLGGGILL